MQLDIIQDILRRDENIEFLEDDIFTTRVPLGELLNKELNEELKIVFEFIQKNEGTQAKNISEILARSAKTIERQVAELIKKGLIERRGSRKTGGYWKVVEK